MRQISELLTFDFKHLKGDVFGGITAGVIALPMALAFGEASGVGPLAGMYTAIILGFLAAFFGGTQTQISGPTGPMTVVFAGLFTALHGQPELIFATVVLGGLSQILFGIIRLGDYVKLVPYPVISGFMTGIGLIIIAIQIPKLVGYDEAGAGPMAAIKSLPDAFGTPNLSEVVLSIFTLGMMFLWPRKLHRKIPSYLAALVLGSILAILLPSVHVLGDIPSAIPEFIWPTVSNDALTIVLEGALILALLGCIDSLLTSLVADNITRTRHRSNREIIGQGIGNTVAGFFGGIPGAGATMMTVANIRSGSKTRLSGMIHAVFLLAIMFVFAPFVAYVPHAVLAGILIKVGYDIIDFSYIKRAHKGPRWDLLLMVLVLGLTVLVDLITAVGVGLVLGTIGFAKTLADDQIDKFGDQSQTKTTAEEDSILAKTGSNIMIFEFSGPLSFGSAADLGHRFRQKARTNTRAIILDFSRIPYVDVSAARAIENIIHDAYQSNKSVYIAALNDEIENTMESLGLDKYIKPEICFSSRLEALEHAYDLFEKSKAKSKRKKRRTKKK